MKTTKETRPIIWNERPVVRVDGMVMVRGELGFTPYSGYENSRVAIYESVNCRDYLIYGYKIKDKSVITLNSLIPPRMAFTKASPIFHHWLIGDQRMGLTFNGTADARSFDRGIRVALENLEKATSMGSSDSSSPSEDASSASPTSNDSFNLSTFDEAADTQPITAQQSLPLLCPGALTNAHSFRQQAMSASSSRQQGSLSSRTHRRHSSSVPGRPQREVPRPEISNPPRVVVEATCAASAHPLLESQKSECSNEDSIKSAASSVDIVRPPPTYARRHKPRQRSESSSYQQQPRSRRTKTPNLDNLERQRDLKPTKPNSYVQIASNQNNATSAIGAVYPFTRLNSRTSESIHLSYDTSRFHSRSTISSRYRGLTTSDDGYFDFSSTPLHWDMGSVKQSSKRSDSKRISDKSKEDFGERLRCRNCQAMFNRDRNYPGSCPDAPPDDCLKCIDNATCMCAPRCVNYSCFRDSEGNYDDEPCACSRHRCGSRIRKFLVLGLLSIFLPCLCLNPALKSCYRCGVSSHCCGGRHEPMVPLSPQNNDESLKLR